VSRGAVPAAYADCGALTRLCGNCGAGPNDFCAFPDGSERHIPCNVRMKPVRGPVGDLDGNTASAGVSDE
jgi:hypothetical protein